MKDNEKLAKWIRDNDGYDYYCTSRFIGVFCNCKFKFSENNEVQVVYGEYIILHMFIQNRSVNLLLGKSNRNDNVRISIQNKLYHEYNNYFELLSGHFKITQYNIYALTKYVESVKRKIDTGFTKYSKLLEENIKSEMSGYLEIGINNAFSLEELKGLIDAYNRLYSLFYYVWENGIEEQENIKQMMYNHNMVLERIHIGSEGVLVSVGTALIVDIIEAFVKAVFEGDKTEVKKRKQELLDKSNQEEYMKTKQHIFQLITLLEKYLDKKEQACDKRIMNYIEIEIDDIMHKIEQLQGTNHINIAV